MDFDTVLEAVYEFKKTMTAKYNIEPTRIYLGFLDMHDLMCDANLNSWRMCNGTESRQIMGLDIYEVSEKRHIHVC